MVGGKLVNQLKKFASFKIDRPIAETTLSHFKHPNFTVVMALDVSAQPPVMWFGSPHGYYAKFGLLRIEDRGDAFGEMVDVGKRAKAPSAGPVTDVSLHPGKQWLYTSHGRAKMNMFDAATGKPLDLRFPQLGGSGNTATIGNDENFYLYHNYPSGTGLTRGAVMAGIAAAHAVENL